MGKVAASIIIPLWNGRRYIEPCLTAVLEQDYSPLEVIVVDNASEDGSADLVAKNFPEVKLIRNQQNLGFSGGCNIGLKIAQGDVLVLLNQDTQVYPGWLQSLSQALQNEKIGIAGCKIFYQDRKTLQHAGAWLDWPLGMPHHYGYQEQDTGQWDEARAVEFVTGAALAIRRDVLNQVGLLDERFWPGYFEDIDLCFRAREAGYEVWYIPAAVTLHQETTSITDGQLLAQFYHRGRLRFLLKHVPPEQFLSEFLPAEESFLSNASQGVEGKTLRLVYLEAIPMAASVLLKRGCTQRAEIEAVVAGLQKLEELAWTKDWQVVEKTITPLSNLDGYSQEGRAVEDNNSSIVAAPPPLQVFEPPQSKMYLFGPLITQLRSLWYRIVTRWAIMYLTEQQEIINRRNIHYIQALERRLRELAEQNTILAAEVAKLELNIRSSNESGGE